MPATAWKTTWVVVADGAKALLFVNEGTDAAPLLRVLAKSELENPPTREQGTDKPGRYPDPMGGQRSAVETTNWHTFAEARFVREFAERLNRAALAGRFDRLILAAPPKVLGGLRAALSPQAADRVTAELPSDLTGHPVSEIERLIGKALQA
jgi:protein required for attachment to host cells